MRPHITLLLLAASQTPMTLLAATPAEILDAYKAATGGTAWDDKVTLQFQFTTAGYGLTGTGHATSDLRDGRSQLEYTLGPISEADGYDGVNRWRREMSGTVTLQQGGDGPELAVNDAYRTSGKWWQADRGGAEISSAGEKPCGAGSCTVLSIMPRNGKPFEAWFDTKTALLLKTVENRQPLTVTTTMSDYRPIGGVMLPFQITVDRGLGEKYRETMILTAAQFTGPLPESVYGPPKVALTDYSIAGGARQTVIPFYLVNNHIHGTARVNGQGPFEFLFDTGATNGITATLARTLGLQIEGATPEFGSGPGIMEGGFARVERLQVGQAVLQGQVFGVAPLDKLEPMEGAPLPGLIGYEVFSRFVTRIDYGAGAITLIDPRHFDSRAAGTPLSIAFHHHIPEVTGTFEGLPARFIIDTGARFELSLMKSFAEREALRAKHPNGIEAVYGWGVGGAVRGYITRATNVTFGDVKVDDVVTNLSAENRGGASGSIGGGLLKRFVVTFDYAHQTIYLKPRPGPVPDTGVFDRSGMWINKSPEGFDVVDVTQGAPAAQAGLRVGDTILAVDGVPASKLRLYALRQQLRDEPPGTVVTLRVKEGTTVGDLKVTLRDLI